MTPGPSGGGYQGCHISGNGQVLIKSNYNPADVYISTNGGTSFTKVSSTITTALNIASTEQGFAINYDGSSIYCINSNKIYVSTDYLSSITQFDATTLSSNQFIRGSQYGKYLLTFNSTTLYLTIQSAITES